MDKLLKTIKTAYWELWTMLGGFVAIAIIIFLIIVLPVWLVSKLLSNF